MKQPLLLDLFCGAGGAGAGYARAGWRVLGVDVKPQPHYPFEFVLGDALRYLEMHAHLFDGVHASPPCQRHSAMSRRWHAEHPDYLGRTRTALQATGKPCVIENVAGAPLHAPILLCGSMFGLGAEGLFLRRHRLFECSFPCGPLPRCDHQGRALPVYGHSGGSSRRDGIRFPGSAAWAQAMEIDWMNRDELAQAIPPAFTHWIGQEMLSALKGD